MVGTIRPKTTKSSAIFLISEEVMETRETLKNRYNIDDEQLNKLLKACGLAGRKKFDDNDRSAIEKIRSYFSEERIHEEDYEAARQLYGEETGAFDKTFGELLTAAEKQDTPVTLSQALQVFKVCKLKEKDRYPEGEVERFLEACLALKDGRLKLDPTTGDNSVSEVSSLIGKTAEAIASSGGEFLVKTAQQKAKDDLRIYQYLYWASLAQNLQSDEVKREQEEMAEMIVAQLEGKAQQQGQKLLKAHFPTLLIESSPANLPPDSENG
jgi:hypothetical protein